MPRHTHTKQMPKAPAFTYEGDAQVYDARTGAPLKDYRGRVVYYCARGAALMVRGRRGGETSWRCLSFYAY